MNQPDKTIYTNTDEKTSELFMKLILRLAKQDSDHLTVKHRSGLTAELTIQYPEFEKEPTNYPTSRVQ